LNTNPPERKTKTSLLHVNTENFKKEIMKDIQNETGTSTDKVIIEKVLAGERALFEVLIRRYNPVLYRIARSYDFNHQDAEDLLQETHVAAYLHLSQFAGKATYKTWVSKIMVHKCLYKLKYGYFKYEMHVKPIQEQAQPLYMKPNSRQPEAKMLNKELGLILENSLQKLPALYRTVFVLREVEGFSVAETAELLQITETNVKVRLNRAKTLLQKEIEQVYNRGDIYSFNLVYCDAIVQKVFEAIDRHFDEGRPLPEI